MIIRTVRMTFQEDKVGEFLEIFARTKNLIRAFEGCKHLELWQDAASPNVFTTFSHWDSVQHLNAYRDSELFGSVWPSTKRLFAAPPIASSNILKEKVIPK